MNRAGSMDVACDQGKYTHSTDPIPRESVNSVLLDGLPILAGLA